VSLEVVTIGRVSVDLYAEELGVPFAEVRSFAKSIGGSPTNVAVAAARLGRRSAVITAVGDEPFGGYVRQKLEGFGVDTRFVGTHPFLRTPLAFAAMDPPEEPQLLFYREPSAPDEHVEVTEELLAAAREADVFWVAGSCLSGDETGPATEALLAARGRRSHTVLDLDYRPTFWRSREEASARIGAAVEHATIAVGNREECAVAVGSEDPHEAAARLRARGVEVAIVKLGGDGVLLSSDQGERLIEPPQVQVVCGLGAGDAFGGALAHGLLNSWTHQRTIAFANAAGGIVASRLLCSQAMPYEQEVVEILAEGRRRLTASPCEGSPA